jgi:hypoxanthine phosphoribosyltransferase
VEQLVQDLCRQLHSDQWHPDYIVGLTKGGLVPATMIAHYLHCRMETLKVSLRDGGECESNLWMAEDAFGYQDGKSVPELRKNILIVDDINDSGATLNWIREDWPSGCMPNDPDWNSIWGHNVRVASLYNNAASNSMTRVSYYAKQINKRERDEWIVFPWETWWTA